jgi:ATP phosphoribosyltransferase
MSAVLRLLQRTTAIRVETRLTSMHFRLCLDIIELIRGSLELHFRPGGHVVRIALSKGRLLKQALPLLSEVGIEPLEDPLVSRKLILDTNREDIQFVIIRATDVPTYVQFGAADIGVVGKDVIMEHGGGGLAELLDLNISRCRLMVAGHADKSASGMRPRSGRLRVATKYVNVARRYFASKGVQTDIIKLYGSMELAPLVGLADRIVDLVETGGTLRANNLVELEHVADISCRLIANVASMRVQHKDILDLVENLREIVVEASQANVGTE